MYNHVLFDADNTLLDFDKAQLICFKKVIEYYDLPFSEDTFQKYESINHALWQMFEQGKIDKDSRKSRFGNTTCTEFQPHPHGEIAPLSRRNSTTITVK